MYIKVVKVNNIYI